MLVDRRSCTPPRHRHRQSARRPRSEWLLHATTTPRTRPAPRWPPARRWSPRQPRLRADESWTVRIPVPARWPRRTSSPRTRRCRENQRRFRQIAVTGAATGTSRTRCNLDQCTRTPVTPQPEQRASPSTSRSTQHPAVDSSPTATTQYSDKLNKVLATSRCKQTHSAIAHGSPSVTVSQQHESQQTHGTPTSDDTSPGFARNHEEPG